MIALLKIDYLQTKRQWLAFVMGIGMPVLFFLLFSSMFTNSTDDFHELTRNYLLTMTGFSMSGFGLFSFPSILDDDKRTNWFTQIQHSPITLSCYYGIKLLRVIICYILAIVVNFTVGALFREVRMPAFDWLMSAILLLLGSLIYLAIGLLCSTITSKQLMMGLSNILFFVLAIFGGSWMPYEVLPSWMQQVAHVMPSYHANQLVLTFVNKGQLNVLSFCIVLGYAVVITMIAIFLRKRQEVN
ncbi:ABC transporter permease [Streptococcus sp. zg-JUN1979]|uniref:ABC transporter permease n=1 Tax=Streptococcus sp. zg-JUN1979 TaxID=3391450 RepID=UPI0039A4B838